MTFFSSFHAAQPRLRAAERRRLALALGASLFVHAWVASEAPPGVARGRPPAPLTVTLEAAAPPAVVQPPASAREALPLAPTSPLRGTARTPAKPAAGGRSPTPAGSRTEHRASLAPHADALYHPARELDVYPALLAPLAIAYPERARAEQRSGEALVLLLIDAAGKVDAVAVVEADPPGSFEDAARRALAAAAFSAGRKDGMPVKSRVLVRLRFDAREAKAAAE